MKPVFLAIAAMCGLVPVAAEAATIVHNTELDLRKGQMAADQRGYLANVFASAGAAPELSNTPLSVTAGDTVIWTMRFANNEFLRLRDISFLRMMMAHADNSVDSRSFGSLIQLLGDGDAVLAQRDFEFGFLGTVSLGISLTATAGTFDVKGVRLTQTIDSFINGPQTQQFNRPELWIQASNISIQSAIPEPGTWALMVLGFGMMGAAMRRRSAARELRVRYN